MYALTSQRREQERLARTELRTVLDAAAHALGESRRQSTASPSGGSVASSPPARTSGRPPSVGHRVGCSQDAKDRIAIRLESGDNAVSSFEAAAGALDRYAVLLAPYLRGSKTDIDGAALEAARSRVVTALDEYCAAAREASATMAGAPNE